MDARAEAYERRYPETGVSEAQAIEREERLRFKERRASGHVTGRTRAFVMPELPWLRREEEQ